MFLAGYRKRELAFAADFLDPSFRTPEEVSAFLNLPVFASIPKEGQIRLMFLNTTTSWNSLSG